MNTVTIADVLRALGEQFRANADELEADPQDGHPEYLRGAVIAFRAAAEEMEHTISLLEGRVSA